MRGNKSIAFTPPVLGGNKSIAFTPLSSDRFAILRKVAHATDSFLVLPPCG